MSFRAAFSFYGSKSKVLDFYPAPTEDLIIEPFAGGASYSLRHGAGRSVWINDADPRVYDAWTFIRDEAPNWLERIPASVESGQAIADLVPDCPPGLLTILRAEANQGTMGADSDKHFVTSMGAKCWPRLRRKLEWAHEQCQGWLITNCPFNDMVCGAGDPCHCSEMRATWFVDPPYANAAGKLYRFQVEDYGHLRNFVLSREGQIIVCEGEGADWLPFTPVVARRGIRSRYQLSAAREFIWTAQR